VSLFTLVPFLGASDSACSPFSDAANSLYIFAVCLLFPDSSRILSKIEGHVLTEVCLVVSCFLLPWSVGT
jgi:hypothetical protein